MLSMKYRKGFEIKPRAKLRKWRVSKIVDGLKRSREETVHGFCGSSCFLACSERT